MGTVAYMSPEQARGEDLDARTDLFSFGAVLYEMATGRQAFVGNTTAVIHEAILNRMPASPVQMNPELPPKLEEIINKALEKDRDVRCQTASELRADLKRLKRDTSSGRSARVEEGSVLPPRETAPEQPGAAAAPSLPQTKRRVTLAAVVLGVAVMAILIYWLMRPLPPPRVTGSVQITSDGNAKVPGFSRPTSLVTDGLRLYFSEVVADRSTLVQVSLRGGETVALPTPFRNAILADISPDRSELLVASYASYTQTEGSLWIVPILGGTPRRVGDILAHDATWLPTAKQIAYTQGSELFLAKTDGSDSRKLGPVSGTATWLRYSPDGARLRFTIDDRKTNSFSLWEISADGTDLHALLPGWNKPPAECCGNWTPDGKYFVFQATRNGKTDLWAIAESRRLFRSTSPEPVQLTAGQLNMLAPVPGTDGKKIFAVGVLPRGELVGYDSKARQFVPYLGGISAEGVNFSRDGKWATYTSFPEGMLWRSRADGSERLQLSYPPMWAFLPRWSPDGRRIAFMAQLPSKPWKLFVVSAEGGAPQQLIPGEEGNEADPCWSPDGDSLTFDTLEQNNGIRILDLRTHQLSTLRGSDTFWNPLWSPDGRYMAATTRDSQQLLLFDFKRQNWTGLAKVNWNYGNWSRDGQYLYFDTVFASEPAFFRLRISDRKLEQLVSLKGIRRAWGLFGPWSGLASDDSPLILRDTGTQEVYALDWEAP